jgi:signal transduction histidine kinase
MGTVLLPAATLDDVAAALDAPTRRYATPLDALDALEDGGVACVVVDAAADGRTAFVERCRRRARGVPVAAVVDPPAAAGDLLVDVEALLDRTDPQRAARRIDALAEEHALERGERVVTAATRRIKAAERALADDPGSASASEAVETGDAAPAARETASHGADSRDAVERALVDTLGGGGPYPAAWVSRHDPVGGVLQPSVAAGVPAAHLGPVRAPAAAGWDGPDGGPTAGDGGSTVDSSAGIVAERVVEDGSVAVEPADGHWDGTGSGRVLIGVRLPATPVGVLYLVGDRPAGVPGRERDALARLGERAGTALDAVATEPAAADGADPVRLLADAFAHELNNHLGAAGTQLDLAAERGDEEHFDHISRALSRLGDLAAETRALAREEPDTETVDVAAVATAAWEGLSTPAASLETESVTVQAAPALLRLALVNLLRNSVEHGSTGNRTQSDDAVEHGSTSSQAEPDDAVEHGATAEGVTVRVEPAGEGFAVADDGPGIPPEKRESVFEWGHSGGRGDGVGLGLVALIAERHGWSVTIAESEAGGARFVFGPSDGD